VVEEVVADDVVVVGLRRVVAQRHLQPRSSSDRKSDAKRRSRRKNNEPRSGHRSGKMARRPSSSDKLPRQSASNSGKRTSRDRSEVMRELALELLHSLSGRVHHRGKNKGDLMVAAAATKVVVVVAATKVVAAGGGAELHCQHCHLQSCSSAP